MKVRITVGDKLLRSDTVGFVSFAPLFGVVLLLGVEVTIVDLVERLEH